MYILFLELDVLTELSMNKKTTVCILMSTYNGQKYIREQLDSLLLQEGVDVRIIIRDDGSKDNTVVILSEYAARYSNIIILAERNCGAEESFNRLCRFALQNETTDYYAFCDQDDVWDVDKLDIAVGKLKEFDANKPNLYFSNLRMVDENLTFMNDLYERDEVFTNRSKTLVQVFTYGCTCVFNHTALEYYCRPERQFTFHDNWIYCICSYLGNVFYDSTGHIQYRQHGNNLSGSHSKGLSLIISRIKRPFRGELGHDFETMAKQLLLFENEIDSDDLPIIRHVSNYRNNFLSRFALFFSRTYSTGRVVKDLCIRYRIMSNTL